MQVCMLGGALALLGEAEICAGAAMPRLVICESRPTRDTPGTQARRHFVGQVALAPESVLQCLLLHETCLGQEMGAFNSPAALPLLCPAGGGRSSGGKGGAAARRNGGGELLGWPKTSASACVDGMRRQGPPGKAT